jgi:hypothetical protein
MFLSEEEKIMIPVELKLKPNWVGHRNKVPIDVVNNCAAAPNNRNSWATYNTVCKSEALIDGIGFMFEPPYVGIDLDDCVVDGKINPFGSKMIKICNSYTEYSPSGTGIHIICKGKLPAPLKTPEIEAYQTGRYFTMTGKRISGHSLLKWIEDFSFLYPAGYKQRQSIPERLNSLREGNRNNTLTGIAGALRAKGFNAETIFEMLKAQAEKVNFPENELWTICRSVERYIPTSTGDNDSLSAFLSEDTKRRYIIPEVLAENTINLIVGLPESRKSWLLLDLALGIASGTDWLGRFKCEPKKVMIIDQERPRQEMQRRLKALLIGKNLELQTLEDNLVPKTGTATRINLEVSYQALCHKIEQLKPDVLLIDSLKTFQTGVITDNTSMQAVFERFKELRDKYNLTILILHHENKGAYIRAREGREVTAETIAGAGSIAEVPENIFIVTKHDDDSSFVHHVKNNYGQKIVPFLVRVVNINEDKSSIKVEAF